MENRRGQCTRIKGVLKRKEPHVFKLSKTKYSLKRVDKREWEVMSTAAVLDYVLDRGFKDIAFMKKAGDFKPYIKRGEELYVMMSMTLGQKLRLKTEDNGLMLTELLGRFHNAAEGFIQPPGIKLPVLWGKRMERLRMSTSRLEKYINFIKDKEEMNEFEEYTQKFTEMLLKRARASMKILKSLGYLRALERSMKGKEISINGISNNTAVIIGDRVVICKIFEIGYNMVEEDIAALIKKLIQDTGDRRVFNSVTEEYFRIREKGEDSMQIIRAFVAYPFESIKVILRYFDYRRSITEEDFSYNSVMLEKFKKNINKELLTDVLGG